MIFFSFLFFSFLFSGGGGGGGLDTAGHWPVEIILWPAEVWKNQPSWAVEIHKNVTSVLFECITK